MRPSGEAEKLWRGDINLATPAATTTTTTTITTTITTTSYSPSPLPVLDHLPAFLVNGVVDGEGRRHVGSRSLVPLSLDRVVVLLLRRVYPRCRRLMWRLRGGGCGRGRGVGVAVAVAVAKRGGRRDEDGDSNAFSAGTFTAKGFEVRGV